MESIKRPLTGIQRKRKRLAKYNHPPKYVTLGDLSALRLDKDRKQYWRHAGAWGVDYKYKKGKLFSHCPSMPWLHNKELIEITKSQWLESNFGHV